MKMARKTRVDFDKMSDAQILEKYKLVYPDRDEANLKEYMHYQRLIHEAKSKKKK